MPKPRFQITAVALMLVIVAGLVFFVRHRESHPKHAFVPPAQMPDSPGNAPPKFLHIEGCDNDIPFTADEDIEPRITPETTLDKLRAAYGKESKREERYDSYIWTRPNFELTVYDPGATKTFHQLAVDAIPGKAVTTPDAIVLGQDTFTTVIQKTRAHGIAAHQGLIKNGNDWVLTVWFPSRCSDRFLSEYQWNILSNPKVDQQIEPTAGTQNGKVSGRHAEIFNDRIASSYHFEIPSQFNTDEAGPPPADN